MARQSSSPPARPDPWGFLRHFTPARIALGRAGGSLPTAPLLAFQWAHARARDAVHQVLDVPRLQADLGAQGLAAMVLHSAAADRATYIRRPDQGRILDDASIARLREQGRSGCDVVFVLADGLSALAVQRHAAPLLSALQPFIETAGWTQAPLCIVRQGRVAIGDEIGALLGATLTVVLIGERPGLSAADSLGIYLTYQAAPGRSNAERNCISNVRPEGLRYKLAAHRLGYLMNEACRRRLSGVALKDEAPVPGLSYQPPSTLG